MKRSRTARRRAPALGSALLLAVGALSLLPSLRAEESAPEGIPRWALDEMAARVGTWIADNSPYRERPEDHDAYGMDWEWAPGQRSVVGRLYPIKNGADLGTVWQFREFWHPGAGALMAYQFGTDGTIGIGEQTRKPDGSSEILQEFFDPAGVTFRVGHRSRIVGDAMESQSFNVDEQGAWQPRRKYVWKKQRER